MGNTSSALSFKPSDACSYGHQLQTCCPFNREKYPQYVVSYSPNSRLLSRLLVGRLSEQRDPIRAVAVTSPAFSPVVFSCLIKCVIRVKQSVLRVVFERGSLSWRSSAPIAATSAMDQMFKNHPISVECMYTDVTLSFMPQTTVMPALLIIMCALSHDVEVWKRGFAVTVTLPISRVRTGSEKKFRVFAFFFFYLCFPFYLLSRRVKHN